jgi:hypothetical protein
MPQLVAGTLKLMGVLRDLSQWAHKHPTLVKALVVGFAALSAAMAFGGMVLLLSAAFSAVALVAPIVGAAVGAVGAGLGALLAAAAPIIVPLALGAAAIAAVGIAIFQIVKHWDSTKGIWGNIKAEFACSCTGCGTR